MKVWITKYALSSGVVEAELVSQDAHDGYVAVKWTRGMNGRATFHRGEWHRTESDARTRIVEMIAAKRKSLAKQATKLEKLECQWGTR